MSSEEINITGLAVEAALRKQRLLKRSAGEPLVTFSQLTVKRCFDVIASAVLIVVGSPVLIILGLLVKCSSKGPAYFKQRRIGLVDRPFTIYKFRTMRSDNAETDHKQYIRYLLKRQGCFNRYWLV